ncbi:MAG: CRISPR-associated endoribonuclease Cas6, partial [Dolichospermum sp.]
MPHSLILNIIPQSPIYPNFLTGRHYHALFLNLVSSVDRKLGDRLHESNADKAFTLSLLQIKTRNQNPFSSLQYNHKNPISAGSHCWWRISLLDDNLFSQ